MQQSIKIAMVQKKPVHLNLQESLKRAFEYITEASKQKAKLIVFGETWLTGYPSWIDYYQGVAQWGNESVKELYSEIHQNSIEVNSREMRSLQNHIKKSGVTVVLGANEKVSAGPGNGTIYNSMFIIGSDGEILNHHRKLMPTFNEKLFYGLGDGAGLNTVDTEVGKIGGLICWEHWMPLSRQALHNEGELIHIALWPAVNDTHQMASKHYAFEGRCFVVAVGQIMQAKDCPENIQKVMPGYQLQDHYLLNGGSCIIGPDGEYLLKPQFRKEEIIYYEIEDLNQAIRERITLDVSGHYSRPDIFSLNVNKERE